MSKQNRKKNFKCLSLDKNKSGNLSRKIMKKNIYYENRHYNDTYEFFILSIVARKTSVQDASKPSVTIRARGIR